MEVVEADLGLWEGESAGVNIDVRLGGSQPTDPGRLDLTRREGGWRMDPGSVACRPAD